MSTPNPPAKSPMTSSDREPIIPLTTSVPASPADAAGVRKRGSRAEKLPRELRTLFAFAPFIALVPQIGNNLSAYFGALQAQAIDPAGKVGALAVVSAVSAAGAMIAGPISGVLSDRTRSRFGRRRPWILITALVGALGLILAGTASSLVVLVITVTIVLIGFGSMQSPLTALLPDRVPTRFRGRYSTFVGLGTLIGGVGASIFGRNYIDRIPTGYLTAAIALVIITILFVIFVKDTDNRGVEREPFSVTSFIKAYWVNPVRYPDFFFGFMGRMLLFGSYGLINTYLLYIAQDYIGLSRADAATLVPLLGVLSLPGILISVSVSGPLSDRIGRRKPLVLGAGLLIVAGAVVPIFSATSAGLIISTIVISFGFGTFISVDQALMSSVLPEPERYGTDLGVLNIASTLPYAIAPAFAGLILGIFGSYFALYVAVGIVALIGALAVMGIKSVR